MARRVEIFKDDVVVLSQACDLEHGKITNVILCPHQSIEDFKNDAWIPWMREKGQNPSEKAWRKYCADIADGFIWNLAILNRIDESGFECKSHRVVNFHDVYSLPREFVETLLSEERVTRVRLLAPYREHLSQAFARFFMRVGLPVPTGCTLDGEGVGARRTCHFDAGSARERITRWEPPYRYEMAVEEVDLPGRPWLGFESAGYELEPLGGRRTRVVRTTTLTSTLRPGPYWRVFERLGTETEHRYVLAALAARLGGAAVD
ncbi:MAG: hypothetical protein KC964_12445 [Candidatus Omnitrophica bacterium]|nr:hypothetical protein [Candidatus Omnitrophota bacterium]